MADKSVKHDLRVVQNFSETFPAVLQSLSKSWNQQRAARLLAELSAARDSTRKTSIRKALACCSRTLSGAVCGIQESQLTERHARVHASRLLTTHCFDFIEAYKAAVSEETAASLSVVDAMRTAIKKVDHLPRKMAEHCMLVEAPVLPVAENFKHLKLETLQSAGIQIIDMDDFLILEDQTLLALNATVLTEAARNLNMDPHKYALQFVKLTLEKLNAKLSGREQLIVFSTKWVRLPNSSIDYVWLMRDSQLSGWLRAGLVAGITMRYWQFPHEVATKESVTVQDNKEEEMANLVQASKNAGDSESEALRKVTREIYTRHKMHSLNQTYSDLFAKLWKKLTPAGEAPGTILKSKGTVLKVKKTAL